jgi:hypothetical protein
LEDQLYECRFDHAKDNIHSTTPKLISILSVLQEGLEKVVTRLSESFKEADGTAHGNPYTRQLYITILSPHMQTAINRYYN